MLLLFVVVVIEIFPVGVYARFAILEKLTIKYANTYGTLNKKKQNKHNTTLTFLLVR